MNKRLIWNFEINTDKPLQLPGPESIDQNQDRWELRFFWPDDQIITLHGLNEHFLELSQYKIKHRQDIYYLLPKADYNIKLRREQLLYKPILMKKGQAVAYGKKINLEEQPQGEQLPGCKEKDVKTLIELIYSQGVQTKVEKEAAIYTFETNCKTKLELASVYIANKAYFSASIESRSLPLVKSISKQLLGKMAACNYVSFLRRSLK